MDSYIGFGIIGNFAGHLSQAGEDRHFGSGSVPIGMFPFYVPKDNTFLGRYCISDHILLPLDASLNVQAEAEIAIECSVLYDNDQVKNLTPLSFMAFNDASIRNNELAIKLSQKKNFSHGSKGIGSKIYIDKFEHGGICDRYSITSFLVIDGVFHQYSEVSKLVDYSFFHGKLIDWIVSCLNNQEDKNMLENLSNILKSCNFPDRVLIAIGSTRYTHMGMTRFLRKDDEICVVAFDNTKFNNEHILEFLRNNMQFDNGISVVRQMVKR